MSAKRAVAKPVELLERTLAALSAMDADSLERLQAEAEGLPPLPVETALACARRAAELQQSLAALLRSTETTLRVLRAVRGRGGSGAAEWEH